MSVNIKDGLERRDWVSMCMQGEGEPEAVRAPGGKGRRASASDSNGTCRGTLPGRTTCDRGEERCTKKRELGGSHCVILIH